MTRGWAFGVTALAALVVGWAQPMPTAEAGFDAAATASTAIGAHDLAEPVLTCTAGLLQPITLRWAQVSSAATPDPYATPPNSTYLADGYEIHRAPAGGAFEKIGDRSRDSSTTFPDNPPGLLTTYHYKVRTVKGEWFKDSNIVTGSATKVLLSVITSCSA